MSPNKNSDKLVYMLNHIGKVFALKPQDQAVAEITDHLKKFWEKRMLVQIFNHVEAGGAGLDPLPKQALQNMMAQSAQTSVN
ncbi:MAG: formate dehydrogenase subunit delta [Acidocella sp.]|nr:formate dehydrogenase subunit delta [Acidocella sp.]